MRITNIGHATLLIELGEGDREGEGEGEGNRESQGGLEGEMGETGRAGRQGSVRILTDPNFDVRLAGVLRRVSKPGLSWDVLPRPDAVLLTHAHADHLSLASLAIVGSGRSVPIYAPPGVARWLNSRGHPSARPLEPGAAATIAGRGGATATVWAGAAAHQGSRYGLDRWAGRGAANTYLIDTGSESVFFAGDTGLRPDSHSLVVERLGSSGRRLDVALLPIGYAPWWRPRFRRGHLSAADALTLFERLDARALVPYHWGTFYHLTSGPFDAFRQLQSYRKTHPRGGDVRIVAPGATIEC